MSLEVHLDFEISVAQTKTNYWLQIAWGKLKIQLPENFPLNSELEK